MFFIFLMKFIRNRNLMKRIFEHIYSKKILKASKSFVLYKIVSTISDEMKGINDFRVILAKNGQIVSGIGILII